MDQKNNIPEGKIEVRTAPDYPATVLAIPLGEARKFRIEGTVYSGLSSAASRLREKGCNFRMWTDKEANYIIIERTS